MLTRDVWSYSTTERGGQFVIDFGLLRKQKWLVGQFTARNSIIIICIVGSLFTLIMASSNNTMDNP